MREPAKRFGSSLGAMPASRATTFASSGVQKPPWQRPMVAPVRHFNASRHSTGSFVRSAEATSASVTSLQRQSIWPASGLTEMAARRSSSFMSLNSAGSDNTGLNWGFSAALSFSAMHAATSTATAGAEVKPGDSKHAISKKPGALGTSPISKSPVSPVARTPANVVMRARMLSAGYVFFAADVIAAKPSAVVAVASLSPWGTAFGPTSMLPCTVGETSTPLPAFVGAWNIVCANRPPISVSMRLYSPRRGVIENT